MTLAALALTVAFPVVAAAQTQPSSSSVPAPDAAMSSRFTSFLTQVLNGHTPGGNVTQQVKTGLTPTLIAQIDSAFTPLGKFRQLQFVSADSLNGYRRYHYMAVFEKGSQGIMFVVDSSGAIAGFFQDQPRGPTQP
jgi:hypothetical protein